MESESKNKILMAAIDEFGELGYDHASTNNIVRRASVSKGLIFHYFESKEKLYHACVEYGIELFHQHIYSNEGFKEKDYFKRTFQFIMCKLEFSNKHPQLEKVFFDAYNHVVRGEFPTVKMIFEEETRWQWELLVKGADSSNFRADIPSNMIFEYIELVVSAITTRFTSKYGLDRKKMVKHMDELIDELKNVEKLVKGGAYK